ncbi:MAG TPA: hypothetical protein VK841_01080 [Polyangiaceae bacterium]|nr:hypothetical protein [Polyangiaceae bacterium]
MAKPAYKESDEQGLLAFLVNCLETLRERMSGGSFEADAIAVIAAGMLVRRRRGQKQKGAVALVNAARAYLAMSRGQDPFERTVAKSVGLSDSKSLELAREHAVSLFALLKAAKPGELDERGRRQISASITGHATGWDCEAHTQATERLQKRLATKLPASVDELLRWAFASAGKATWLNAKDSAVRKRRSRAKKRKLVTSRNVSK